jgi:hypothetical protein
MPERIQRKRTKGWRMPEGALYVGRGSGWGNPWSFGEHASAPGTWWCSHSDGFGDGAYFDTREEAAAHAVALYRELITHAHMAADFLTDLAGRDLACWCPLDQPCHGDILLEIANGGPA